MTRSSHALGLAQGVALVALATALVPGAGLAPLLVAGVVLGLAAGPGSAVRGPAGLAWAVADVVVGVLAGHLALHEGGRLALAGALAAGLAVALLLEPGHAPRVARLVRVEGAKLVRSRLFLAGLAAAALATLAAGLLRAPLEDETGWSVAAHTLGAGAWTAEIFLLVLGATAVAGEASQGTLRMILPLAYHRSEWIAAKALVLLAATLVFGVVVGAVGVGHAAALYDFGDVTQELEAGFGYEEGEVQVKQTAEAMRDRIAETGLATLAALGASALLGLLLSTLFPAVVPALSATFLLFLGLLSADTLLGLSRDVLRRVYAWHPGRMREVVAELGRGLDRGWEAGRLAESAFLALAVGAFAWTVAAGLFGRRDLHG